MLSVTDKAGVQFLDRPRRREAGRVERRHFIYLPFGLVQESYSDFAPVPITARAEKAEAVRRARKLARKKLPREGLLPMKPREIQGTGGRGRPARAPRF